MSPDLYTGTAKLDFHLVGKTPNCKDKLKMRHNILAKMNLQDLKNTGGMASSPAPLLISKELSFANTSPMPIVKLLRSNVEVSLNVVEQSHAT